ncbi:hypothetical protein [Lysinibacillus irui]|uniref:hypothetical protein n=1 Tax=Lysinibacillus irui TaxID=2998077 RepID=UPI002AD4667D|nr:hypothetical protein [Lysinibacillus irui]MEA0564070.1 hypothetical protein [Lysinibacillus irui]
MNVEMLNKRREVLKEINVLLLKCNCQVATEFQSCPNCKQIAKLGQKLLRLVNKRKDSKPVDGRKFNMTKSEYLAMKDEGITDKEIAKMCNVIPCTVSKWKMANGIVTKPIRKRAKAK